MGSGGWRRLITSSLGRHDLWVEFGFGVEELGGEFGDSSRREVRRW